MAVSGTREREWCPTPPSGVSEQAVLGLGRHCRQRQPARQLRVILHEALRRSRSQDGTQIYSPSGHLSCKAFGTGGVSGGASGDHKKVKSCGPPQRSTDANAGGGRMALTTRSGRRLTNRRCASASAHHQMSPGDRHDQHKYTVLPHPPAPRRRRLLSKRRASSSRMPVCTRRRPNHSCASARAASTTLTSSPRRFTLLMAGCTACALSTAPRSKTHAPRSLVEDGLRRRARAAEYEIRLRSVHFVNCYLFASEAHTTEGWRHHVLLGTRDRLPDPHWRKTLFLVEVVGICGMNFPATTTAQMATMPQMATQATTMQPIGPRFVSASSWPARVRPFVSYGHWRDTSPEVWTARLSATVTSGGHIMPRWLLRYRIDGLYPWPRPTSHSW